MYANYHGNIFIFSAQPTLVSRVCHVLLRLLEVCGEVLSDEDKVSLRCKVMVLRDQADTGPGGGVAEEMGGAPSTESSVAELGMKLAQARRLLLLNQVRCGCSNR